MTMLIPVDSALSDGVSNLVGGVKAQAVEGQRAQGLPARFNQIEPGRIGRLEQETDTFMSQGPQTNIHCLMDREIIQDQDQLSTRPNINDAIQQSYKISTPARSCTLGGRQPSGWLKCAERPDLSPSA